MTKLSTGWTEDKASLRRAVTCQNFLAAVKLVDQIAVIAEELQHHPNLHLTDYKQLEIITTSHESDSVTDKDYQLAEKINKLL